MHVGYKTYDINEDEDLIKDGDIWPYIKDKFILATEDSATDDIWLLDLLHKCINSMEVPSRHLILDSDCLKAYRRRIEGSPAFYIKKFVFLGGYSTHPDFNTVACEPFWRQIFGGDSQFEIFINECIAKKIEKADLVSNFWQLYKANDFKPIEFQNQGNVQEKIDNNLVEEVRKLEEMKRIEDGVSKIPKRIDSVSDGDKTQYKQLLLHYKNELDKIKLYISLNGRLRKEIEEKLEIFG